MAETPSILAVDDSTMIHKQIARLLGERFNLSSAQSGQACLDAVQARVPDLIILDVTMPDMDGYEVCRRLRAEPATREVPIVFLSGRCSIEEKLEGYEAGGDDYLTKPFDDNEVLVKIEKHLALREAQRQWQRKALAANEVAYRTLNENSNLAICLRCLQSLHSTQKVGEVLDAVFAATQAFGVGASIQYREDDALHNVADDGKPRELEFALLHKAREGGAVVELGQRLVVNSDELSLLVRSQPEDPEARQLLANHLLTLLQAASDHLKASRLVRETRQKKDLYARMILRTRRLLQQANLRFHHVIKQSGSVVEDLVAALDTTAVEVDLNERQEQAVSAIGQAGLERMNDVYSQILSVDEEFTRITDELRAFQQLTEEPATPAASTPSAAPGDRAAS